MWKNTEKKASVWTRLEVDSDIDELIYGDYTVNDEDNDDNGSDR